MKTEKEIAALTLSLLDLTRLGGDDTDGDIRELCAAARGNKVAAVCVWPKFAPLCAELLAGSGVRVAAVANFPGGEGERGAVLEEIRRALEVVDEIDLVFPWRDFLHGGAAGRARARLFTRICKLLCGDKTLKVIIETGELGGTEVIRAAAAAAIAAGADFIKTSSGKTPGSATPAAAHDILGVIAEHGAATGFKAAGGIATVAAAAEYIAIADHIMGADYLRPARFRIGASSLLDDARRVLDAG